MSSTSQRLLFSSTCKPKVHAGRAWRVLGRAVYCGLAAVTLCIVAGAPTPASAVTITFKEDPNEGPTNTTVDVTDCQGACFDIVQQGGNEGGTAGLSAPPNFFPGFPSAFPSQVTQYEAILVEPKNTPGEIAGSISDRVLLTVTTQSGDPSLPMRVEASFASDSDKDVHFPPAGVFPPGTVGVVTETGTLQDISGNFHTFPQFGVGLREPFQLPPNLIIQVQSDLVPEPSAGVLLAAGLLVLIAAGCTRVRQRQGGQSAA